MNEGNCWSLAGYDERGAPVYAYIYGDGRTGAEPALTHRRDEAKPFESEAAAAAALPLFANLKPDLQKLLAFGLRPMRLGEFVAVYGDGSGEAEYYMRLACGQISQEEERLVRLRDFIRGNQERLSGLSWSAGSYRCMDPAAKGDAETEQIRLNRPFIEISPRMYRQKPIDPLEVAALWPELRWKRVRPRYGMDHDCEQYDWIAVQGDVVIVLRKADSRKMKIDKFPEEGTAVVLVDGSYRDRRGRKVLP